MNNKINIINPKNLILDSANLIDINDVFNIEAQVFEDPWTVEMFENIFKNNASSIAIARYNSKIIGFLVSTLVLDELQIDNLAVDKSFRNLGIASSLIKYLVKKSKSFNKIFLEVSVNNFSALSLYRKLGFTKTYIRKKYYSNGDDAIVMVCNKETFKG